MVPAANVFSLARVAFHEPHDHMFLKTPEMRVARTCSGSGAQFRS